MEQKPSSSYVAEDCVILVNTAHVYLAVASNLKGAWLVPYQCTTIQLLFLVYMVTGGVMDHIAEHQIKLSQKGLFYDPVTIGFGLVSASL